MSSTGPSADAKQAGRCQGLGGRRAQVVTAKGRRASPLGDENVLKLTAVVDAQVGICNTHLTVHFKSLSFVLCEFSLNSNADIQDPKLLLDLGSPSLLPLRPAFSVVTRQGESACPQGTGAASRTRLLPTTQHAQLWGPPRSVRPSPTGAGAGTGAALRMLGAGFRSWREALLHARKGGEGPREVCGGSSDGAVARDGTIFVR